VASHASLKALLAATRDIVSTMIRGVSPDKSLFEASPFMKRVRDLLAAFLRDAGDGDEDETSGCEAAQSLFGQLQAKQRTVGKLDLSDLNPLAPFRFLLSSDDSAVFSGWVAEAIKGGIQSAKAPGKASKGGSGSASSSSASKGGSALLKGLFD
jgi:hypothetical protein